MNVRELMQVAPVIPVLVVHNLKQAIPLAEALVAGGLRVLEVTLRTPQALDAIKAMAQVEGAIVGVGTALDAQDLQRSRDQGATFAVSPGYTDSLGAAARQLDMPLLPGVASSTEIMQARDGGYTALKFFPAEQAGGTALLKALGGPFADIVFCPTGGINATKAPGYLALNNVLCVGGSWVAPKAMMEQADWEGIKSLATAACAIERA